MLDLLIVPTVAALVILGLHAYLGLHVIARGVIFVDLAFAQIAALGATFGLLWGLPEGGLATYAVGFGFTLVGAVIFAFTRLEDSQVPQEAIIGITYVVASAAVLLVAGLTAEGAEHVNETLTGALIWADWGSVLRLLVPYSLLGAFYWIVRRPIHAVTFHPETVEHPRLWDFIFYATFGLAITFSVAIAGVLMVFSTLVVPAVIAFLFTSDFSRALVIAWISGAVAIVGGVAVSFWMDLATGPLLVCAFGAVLMMAALLRRLGFGRRRSAV